MVLVGLSNRICDRSQSIDKGFIFNHNSEVGQESQQVAKSRECENKRYERLRFP